MRGDGGLAQSRDCGVLGSGTCFQGIAASPVLALTTWGRGRAGGTEEDPGLPGHPGW